MRLTVIGRRDRLPDGLADEIAPAEKASARGTRLDTQRRHRLFGPRRHRERGRRLARRNSPQRAAFSRLLAWQDHGTGRDVDLMIRTGGEKRLSDFLLWECAYAELLFTDALWPDFGAGHLRAALADFHTASAASAGCCSRRNESNQRESPMSDTRRMIPRAMPAGPSSPRPHSRAARDYTSLSFYKIALIAGLAVATSCRTCSSPI